MPKVSVIIPTYNHALYVGEAIDSALGQTHADCEVIVVDDGSTDETAAVLAGYGERIIAVRQENGGLSAARKRGLALARGEFVQFLDADDLLAPQKIERQTAHLTAHRELGLTYCAWGQVDAAASHVVREVHPQRSGMVLRALLRREFFPAVGAVLVRRECLDAVGGFDPSLRAAEDIDLWLRIARAGYRFGYEDEVQFYYRDTPGSLTKNLANQLHFELRRIDKFFADATLPPGLAPFRGVAVAAIHLEYAARYLAAADEHSARKYIEAAAGCAPELLEDDVWIIGWLSGFVGGAGSGPEMIDALVELLPLSEARRAPLARRARGRMHADLLFRAHDAGGAAHSWIHVLPAVVNEPRLLMNRGFLRVAADAFTVLVRPVVREQPVSRCLSVQ